MQQSKKQILASIDVCMGGIVAEELTFGVDEVTSGASSDIQKATALARNMVERFGMSSTGKMFIQQALTANNRDWKVKTRYPVLTYRNYLYSSRTWQVWREHS